MSDEPTESRAVALLRATGLVPAPKPHVLEDAREVLWSAIAGEMLGPAPERHQTARRQRNQTPRERKRPAGGAEPGR